jgi:hypothetical protein
MGQECSALDTQHISVVVSTNAHFRRALAAAFFSSIMADCSTVSGIFRSAGKNKTVVYKYYARGG